MTNHSHKPKAGPPQLPPMACLGCIQERKVAEMNGVAEEELPELQVAITLIGGNASCYGHIVIQQQSPLLAANGHGLPPGLRRQGG